MGSWRALANSFTEYQKLCLPWSCSQCLQLTENISWRYSCLLVLFLTRCDLYFISNKDKVSIHWRNHRVCYIYLSSTDLNPIGEAVTVFKSIGCQGHIKYTSREKKWSSFWILVNTLGCEIMGQTLMPFSLTTSGSGPANLETWAYVCFLRTLDSMWMNHAL